MSRCESRKTCERSVAKSSSPASMRAQNFGSALRSASEFNFTSRARSFETFVNLIGLELADGDAPHEAMKNIRTERLKDATHLHS